MPGVHTRPGRAARRYGRNWVGVTRGGSPACLRSWPRGSDRCRSIRGKLAMKSTAQVGLTALFIFQHIFKAKFEPLGIREEIDRLRGENL